MKRTVLYYFFAAQLLFSCYAEQDNPLIVPTCMDGIMNQDEEGVDCGGICGECAIMGNDFVVPCEASLVDNLVTVQDVKFSLANASYTTTQGGKYYTIHIEFSNQRWLDLDINSGPLPKENTAYVLDDAYDFAPGKVRITYSVDDGQQTNYFYSHNGRLYLVYQNGKPVVEICPVKLVGSANSSVDFSAKIICK